MATYIALLRAVNVGGTGKLPMKDLRAACEEAGLDQVSTYIASGNLVFTSRRAAAGVKRLLGQVLHERFGMGTTTIVLRGVDDLARVAAANPFAEAARLRPSHLAVAFLDGRPPAEAAERLAAYHGPERLRLDGEHLYVDYVNGMGTSRLSPAIIERAVGVPQTTRNWNTTLRLLEMGRALQR